MLIADVLRSEALRIAAAALAFRVTSAILALLILLAFPLDPNASAQPGVWGRPSPFWDAFARHDSGWYLDIARRGYNAADAIAGGRSNIAFAPVYPLAMRYLGRLFGRAPRDTYLAGILIAWLSFAGAMVALYYLAALDLPPRRAERAALLAAIFPFAFFLGAIYTESTFLLFAVLSFYGFRTRRWALGGVCGAIATATRTTGILMWPALAWTAWRSVRAARDAPHPRLAEDASYARGVAPRREYAAAAAGLIVATLGFVAYSLWVYYETGNPLLWAAAISRWGSGYRPGGAPWSAPVALVRALTTHPYVFLTSGPMAVYDALYGVTALLFVIAIPFVWRRLGAAYGLFMALNLYVPLSSGAFEGLGRYCSVLFPCFIWLASLRSRWLGTALVVAFALFYTLGLALFVTARPLF